MTNTFSNTTSTDGQPRWVAIYARTSTEDQAERQTVQGQLEFLRRFCTLYSHVHRYEIADEYVDDGWSGTIPLGERPDGKRLLEDARSGRFQEVLVYRLDRLGRSLRSLLDANTALEQVDVTIHSATEPFDTATPIGRFVFQLLGSLAELERSTITERMTLGRDRVARAGKWTTGPVPLGYELDKDGFLMPSTREVGGLGLTEAEVIADLFRRIAEGSTTIAEARRFNMIGVPVTRHYGGGKEVVVSKSGVWPVSRINYIIRSPTYKGIHVFNAKGGRIEREVPPLVTPEQWQLANDQITKNRTLSRREGTRKNLLRGLIRCGDCGYMYAGAPSHNAQGWSGYYYRCSSQIGMVHPDPATRCKGKMVPAEFIENEVWQDCRTFILNPGEMLTEAQNQLRERLEQSAGLEAERARLERVLEDKDRERERVMTLFRRGLITLREVEDQLGTLSREAVELRALVDSLDAQADLVRAWESRVVDAAVILDQLRERLADIEGRDDWEAKRQIVELLVDDVAVHTQRRGKTKQGTVTIRYTFGEPHHAELSNTDVSTGNHYKIQAHMGWSHPHCWRSTYRTLASMDQYRRAPVAVSHSIHESAQVTFT